MKEFSVTLSAKELGLGLRRSWRQPRNSGGLVECHNLKAKETGLELYEPLRIPFNLANLVLSGIELEWPLPQLVRGTSNTFLLTSKNVYIADEESWEFVALDIYDMNDQPAEPRLGGVWQVADFGKTWFMTNGFSNLFYDGNKVRVQNFSRIETTCYHQGRHLIGGFEIGEFWPDEWKDFFVSRAQAAGLSTDVDLGKNFVMWSSVGHDLTWIFKYQESINSHVDGAGYGEQRPFISELFLRNDFGWMPLSWRGKVRGLKPILSSRGDSFVIAYGDDGISLLVPSIEPAPTYGEILLSRKGVNNTGAIGGNERIHVFLDSDGKLNRITSSLEVEELGYEEFFEGELDTDFIISFDELRNEFYISNGYKSFILTPFGLTSHGQIVTSVITVGNNHYCLGGDLEDPTIVIVTDEIDFGESGLKTIQWIKIGAKNAEKYKVALDYKYHSSDEFERSRFVQVNKEGAAYLPVAGTSFRVVLQAEVYDVGEADPPDWIEITFKLTDKRFTRGVNVNSIATRPSS